MRRRLTCRASGSALSRDSCPSHSHTSSVVGATSPEACNCWPGYYSRTWPVGDCKSCDGEYATCPGGLSQPYPDQFYWTHPYLEDQDAEILRCRFTFVCLGGSRPAACAGDYAEQHGGACRGSDGSPLGLEDPAKWCSYGKNVHSPMCEDMLTSLAGRSYWAFSTQTYRCPSTQTYRAASTVVVWCLLFVLFILINDVIRPRFSVLDVVLDSFQDLGVISGYWLYWPPALDGLFAIYNIALFDVDMYTPSCTFPKWGFTHSFYLMMAMPFFYAAYAATYTLLCTERTRTNWLEFLGSSVSFLFGSTPSLLSYTLGTFACRPIAGYGRMLVEAPEQHCGTAQVDAMRVVASPRALRRRRVLRRRDDAAPAVQEPPLRSRPSPTSASTRPSAPRRSTGPSCACSSRRRSPSSAPPCGVALHAGHRRHLRAPLRLRPVQAQPFLEPVLNLFELLGLCMSSLAPAC